MKKYADENDLENQKRPCEICLKEVNDLVSADTGEEILEVCKECQKEIEKTLN